MHLYRCKLPKTVNDILVFEVRISLNEIITDLCWISLTLISIRDILTTELFRVFRQF